MTNFFTGYTALNIIFAYIIPAVLLVGWVESHSEWIMVSIWIIASGRASSSWLCLQANSSNP